LWRIAADKLQPLPALFKKPTAWINSLVFTGSLLAIAGQDATVRLWNLAPAEPQEVAGPVREPFGRAQTAIFSPQLPLLATGHDGEGIFRLWDPRRGAPQIEPRSSPAGFQAAFAPDGRTLAIAPGFRAGLQIWKQAGEGRWDPASPVGDPVQVVNFNPVLAYTPNGKTLAASVSGTLVNLYDVSGDRPREFAALAGHTRPVVAIVFAPDGKIAATAGEDGWPSPAIRSRATPTCASSNGRRRDGPTPPRPGRSRWPAI
jgi:WD40 repeat protein